MEGDEVDALLQQCASAAAFSALAIRLYVLPASWSIRQRFVDGVVVLLVPGANKIQRRAVA